MKKIIAITAAISMFAAYTAAFAANDSPSNPTPVPNIVTVSTPKPATGIAKPTEMPTVTEVPTATSEPEFETDNKFTSEVEKVIKDAGSNETYVELSFGDSSGNDVTTVKYGVDYVVKDKDGNVLSESEAYNRILNGEVDGLSVNIYNGSIKSVSYDVYNETAGTVTRVTAEEGGSVVVATLAPGNHSGGSNGGSDTYKSVASRKATTAPSETEETTAPDATDAPDATTEPTSAPIEIVNPSVTDAPIATVAPTDGGTTEMQNGLAGTTGANATTAADAADTVASLSDGKNYVEYSTYDVWASDDVKDQIASTPGSKVSMTLDAGLYPNDEFIAVVNYGDGWVQVPADDVVVNGDGTVTVLLDNTGVVSFWVPGSEFAEVAYEAPAGGKNAGRHAEPVSVKAASNSNDTPCKDADYTVEKSKDYTQVSPQTGYAEAWVVEASTPAGL